MELNHKTISQSLKTISDHKNRISFEVFSTNPSVKRPFTLDGPKPLTTDTQAKPSTTESPLAITLNKPSFTTPTPPSSKKIKTTLQASLTKSSTFLFQHVIPTVTQLLLSTIVVAVTLSPVNSINKLFLHHFWVFMSPNLTTENATTYTCCYVASIKHDSKINGNSSHNNYGKPEMNNKHSYNTHGKVTKFKHVFVANKDSIRKQSSLPSESMSKDDNLEKKQVTNTTNSMGKCLTDYMKPLQTTTSTIEGTQKHSLHKPKKPLPSFPPSHESKRATKNFKKLSFSTSLSLSFSTSVSIPTNFIIFVIILSFRASEAIQQEKKNSTSMVSNSTQTDLDPLFFTNVAVAVTAACLTIFIIIIVVICFLCIYRHCYDQKLLSADDSLVNSFYHDGKDSAYVPVFVERKMAQSAQMFFYQFQKQQLIAQERESAKRHSVDSTSDTEKDPSDAPMISCPGLALHNGEDIEVRNPLFAEDISASPGWNTTTPANQSTTSTNENSADEIVQTVDHKDEGPISPPPPSLSSLSRPSSITPPATPLNNTPIPNDTFNHDTPLPNSSMPSDMMVNDDNNNKIPLSMMFPEKSDIK